jgi:hypothetical protein
MRRSRRFRIPLKSVLIVVTIGLVLLAVTWYWSFSNFMRDLYTPCQALNLVIEHMETHNGAWPRSWDELHETFVKSGNWRGSDWSEFPRRVGIDFKADPAKLADSNEENGVPPFHVIWSLAYPDGPLPTRPNELLLQYLREQNRKAAAKNEKSKGSAALDRRR